MTCPSHEKHKVDFPRRGILKSFFVAMLFWFLRPAVSIWAAFTKDNKGRQIPANQVSEISSGSTGSHGVPTQNLGVSSDGMSDVYLIKGGSPEQNMVRLLDMLGGIENIIGKEDIVILKPNAQWWNQGMTNTNAMKAFIEEVLAISGFDGEIIIADNHQFRNPNSRAWTTQHCNGNFNYNELVAFFREKGFTNVTKYHWQCAGPNPNPLQGDAAGESRVVKGPWEGDGYVWRDDIVYVSPMGRKCMLTYPVFTSSYSAVTIDFKKGAWKNGEYTGQPVKFINFSALNHHGPYVGVTASIKNYMGIVDMTCGFQGSTPQGYYNTHYIGLRRLSLPLQKHMPWRIKDAANRYNWKYFHHTAGVLGTFMREIRMADLNFITAYWIGWGSRIKTEKSGYPKALLASRDPVALDFVACQEVLYPLTRDKTDTGYFLRLNDASLESGPLKKFLKACFEETIGNISPDAVRTNRL